MRPVEPIIELLAIKLYEHDFDRYPPVAAVPWGKLLTEDRARYRDCARGLREYGTGPNDVMEGMDI